MTSIEKLDAALGILSITTGHLVHFNKSIVDITKWVTDLSEAEIVLDHLIEEGYAKKINIVRSTEPIDFFTDRIYHITFKGKVFVEQGGYGSKLLNDQKYQQRVSSLEIRQERSERSIFFLNLTIAIATGCLLLLEIIKFVISRL